MKGKLTRRDRIRFRIRSKIKGTSFRPRLSVFRSNKEIYAQVIDDLKGVTICSASSIEDGIAGKKGTKIEIAALVGKAIASKAKSEGISGVIFDRGGYLFHGRVKALADGAREEGLIF